MSISFGRFDIQSSMMLLSKVCSAPRRGNLDRMKRIDGYLCKYRHFKIRFRVDELDYSNVPLITNHNRAHTQGYVKMLHIASKYNFSEILTKHWGHQVTYYELIQPVFHYKGNTSALFLDDIIKVRCLYQ